jgi:WD40 repeat protein
LVGSGQGLYWKSLTDPDGGDRLLIQDGHFVSLATSANGDHYAAGTADGLIYLLDAQYQVIGKSRLSTAPITQLRFSPDGRFLLSGFEAFIALYSVEQPLLAVGGPTPVSERVTAIDVGAGARRVLVGCANGRVHAFGSDLEQKFTVGHETLISSVNLSDNGRSFLTTSYDQSSRIWDASTGVPLTAFLRHEKRVNCGCHGDAGRVVATGSHDGSVRLWQVDGGDLIATIRLGSPVIHVSFNHAADRWTFVSQAGEVVARKSPKDPMSDEELSAYARRVSGHHLDASNSVVPLSTTELKLLWNQLPETVAW